MLSGKMGSKRFQEILTEKRSEINGTVEYWVENHVLSDTGESFLGLLGASKCVMWLLDKPHITRALGELASENPTLPLGGFLPNDLSTWQDKHFIGYLRAVLAALRILDDELTALNLSTLEGEDGQAIENLVRLTRSRRKEFLHQFARMGDSEGLHDMLELYGQTIHRNIVELCEKLLVHTIDNCLLGFLEHGVAQWVKQ